MLFGTNRPKKSQTVANIILASLIDSPTVCQANGIYVWRIMQTKRSELGSLDHGIAGYHMWLPWHKSCRVQAQDAYSGAPPWRRMTAEQRSMRRFVASLPRTRSGKITRSALKEVTLERERGDISTI